MEPEPRTETAAPPGRRRLPVLLVPIVGLSVLSTVGDWFAPAIITEHPLLQILLTPRIRYLTLASGDLDAASFYLAGFFRLVLSDPLYYLLGLWYGAAALRWMERHWTGERTVRTVERWFGRAGYPIVALAPNAFVCLLAGATGMRPPVFAVLNVGGTVVRLVLIRAFAGVFQEPLDAVLGFIDRYQWWLVGVSVAVGLLQFWRHRRMGRHDLEPVSVMEREIEEEARGEGADED